MSSRRGSLAPAAGADRSVGAGAVFTAVFFVATLKAWAPGRGSEGLAAWCWRPRVGDISYSLNVARDRPVIVPTCARVRAPNPSGGTRSCQPGALLETGLSGRAVTQAGRAAAI